VNLTGRLEDHIADPDFYESWTRYLPALYPFVAAILLWLIAPLITRLAKRVLAGQIAQDMAAHNVSPDHAIPPPLDPSQIDDYVEYVADAVQIIPAVLLPVFGGLVGVEADVSAVTALLIMFVAVIVLLVTVLWVFALPSSDYVSRKKFGCYSWVTLIGILTNVAAIVMILLSIPAAISPVPTPCRNPSRTPTSVSSPVTARTYRVVGGDTLWDLAQRYYGDPTQYPGIASASGVADPNLLWPGQVLTIPCS
jgi:hypothetical protein